MNYGYSTKEKPVFLQFRFPWFGSIDYLQEGSGKAYRQGYHWVPRGYALSEVNFPRLVLEAGCVCTDLGGKGQLT